MEHVDCLIIGQGICGSFLSWWLQQAGQSHRVWDESLPQTASKAAAGIINPVTGRRIVKTWMIEELLPFAFEAYGRIGAQLGINCIRSMNTIDFFPSPQMRLAFLKRLEDGLDYLRPATDETKWSPYFRDDFGWGEIQGCYLIDLQMLLEKYREVLRSDDRLREDKFHVDELRIEPDGVRYRDIRAQRIIFCDGVASANNPYFRNLPFAPNKGEALILEIPGLPAENIYKKGMNLVPMKNDFFWIGSSYEWTFDDPLPSNGFRTRTETLLKEWLRIPFQVIDHLAAVRPATLERRPFVGFHPQYRQIGILNGMGTKGCSLAPFFSKQLVEQIVSNKPILPEADISRFTRILSMGSL